MKRILFALTLLASVPAAAVSAAEPAAGKFSIVGERQEKLPETTKAACKTIPEWAGLALKARSKRYRGSLSHTILRISRAHRAKELTAAEVAQCREAARKFAQAESEDFESVGLESLGYVGTAEDVPLLVSHVDGANGVTAVTALLHIGTPEARKALEVLEKEVKKPPVRNAVLEALDYLDLKM